MDKAKFMNRFLELNLPVEIIGELKGWHDKVECKCLICGEHYTPTPNNLVLGKIHRPCAIKRYSETRKSSTEEFVEKLKNMNPYILVIGEYIDAKTKIRVKCLKCGYEWDATPNSLLSNHGCPQCHYTKLKKIKPKNKGYRTSETYIKEIEEKLSNIKVLSDKINTYDYFECQCKECGHIWDTTYKILINLKKDRWCPVCCVKKWTQEELITNLNNRNIETTSEVKGYGDKISCKCKICNYEWDSLLATLMHGGGCPKCEKRTLKTTDEFIDELKYINPDIEITSDYINSYTKIGCKCKICNTEWLGIPGNLLQGMGCPNCKKSRGERIIRQFLIDNNIRFISQKKYDGLLGVSGRLLSYDFYLEEYNLLIEFQGKQHEQPIDFFGGEEQFIIQQEHDERKRKYAKLNNINLLEIWYYDIDNIKDILCNYLNCIK